MNIKPAKPIYIYIYRVIEKNNLITKASPYESEVI